MKQISKLILGILLSFFIAFNFTSAQTATPPDETINSNQPPALNATGDSSPQQSPASRQTSPQASIKPSPIIPPAKSITNPIIPADSNKNTDLKKEGTSPASDTKTIISNPPPQNNNFTEAEPAGWWEELKNFLWKLIDTVIGIILGLIARITLALVGLTGILFVAFFGLLWWFWRKGWITRALEWYNTHPFWSLLVAFIFLILAALLIFLLPEGAALGLVIFVLLLALILILGGIILCLMVIWNLGIKPLWNWLTKAWQKLKGIFKIWFPVAEMICRQWDEHMEKICDEWEKIWRCDEWEKIWRCNSWHWTLRWLCLLGEWVTTGVCKLGEWVTTGVCKLGEWVTTGLCKLFHWVTTKVCKLWVRVIRWVAE